MRKTLLIVLLGWPLVLCGQNVTITINAGAERQVISPYIYAKNSSLEESAQYYRDAGIRMVRLNHGNNLTKYNWRKKISSHPDWYNNVYDHDWDAKIQWVAEQMPELQAMWAFQLLGKVASNKDNNFNDWEYNQAQWWAGIHQNLAGGGIPNEEDPSGHALVAGDPSLYLQDWTPDSTVALLDHWFGEEDMGLDNRSFRYWNMDNEPDIWSSTHDDAMPDGLLPAEEFIAKYVEVATKARAEFPDIVICGPVITNEWQWYRWGDENLSIDGKYYCWLEYFIKRMAEEEAAAGIRMLDVVDIHSYPVAATAEDALQNHRIYYDETFDYPGANGVKTINGGWDDSQTKEYIMARAEAWLDEYYGEGHGITVGMSEWGPATEDANVAAVTYASHIGVFAAQGTEYFIPWNWRVGMWEVLHLFARYGHPYSVSATSSDEAMVSAYTSISEEEDSLSVMLVNRHLNDSKNVTVNFSGINIPAGVYETRLLADLPAIETFQSHSNNALQEGTATVSGGSLTLTLPPLSTTAVLLQTSGGSPLSVLRKELPQLHIYPNPSTGLIQVRPESGHAGDLMLRMGDMAGRTLFADTYAWDGKSAISLDVSHWEAGTYWLRAKGAANYSLQKIIIEK